MVNLSDPILAEYLSEQETAKQLGVSYRTLIRWRALKEGPAATRVGRKVLYKRSTVAKWLEKQEDAA